MQKADGALEYSLPIDPAKLDRDGETVKLAPSDAERASIARRLGLLALKRFSGDVTISPWGRGGWQVSGTFHAVVDQECVVSLEPVENAVEDGFQVRYLPEKALAAYEPDAEVMVGEVTEEDPPELLPEIGFDVGEVAVEYLSLALDPYPRKEGLPEIAESENKDEGDGTKENPFAVLSKLKKSS